MSYFNKKFSCNNRNIHWHLKDLITEYITDGYRFFIKDHTNHSSGGVTPHVKSYLQPSDRPPRNKNVGHLHVHINTFESLLNTFIPHRPLSKAQDQDIRMWRALQQSLDNNDCYFRRLKSALYRLDVTLMYRTGVVLNDWIFRDNFLCKIVTEPTQHNNTLDFVFAHSS